MDESKLTPDDPVSKEDLSDLLRLDDAKDSLARRLADLELQKVQIMGAFKKAGEQHDRLMSKVLVDRGLPPDALVSIDVTTGMLVVLKRTE